MESFLDKFPCLKRYIFDTKSTGEQITRLNIIIANIRNALGWSVINPPYDDYIIMDLQKDDNMYEFAGDLSPAILKLLLKCMVYFLWEIMDIALSSETLLEGEEINIDFENLKNTIMNYGKNENTFTLTID
jgi:hypothetical protein